MINEPAEVVYRLLRVDDGPAAEEIEALCYPHLDARLRLKAEEVRPHVELFPEGAMAAEIGGRLVGMALGWLMDFDFDNPQHTLADVCEPQDHNPIGKWYYGLDISVHPEAQGRGIGKGLYRMRHELVRQRGLRGIVAGGMIPGYRKVMHETSPEEYVADVLAGRRRDPTLSFQLSVGFTVRGLLPGYVSGTAGGGVATLLVWENPDLN